VEHGPYLTVVQDRAAYDRFSACTSTGGMSAGFAR
jgi:hypothetical protein